MIPREQNTNVKIGDAMKYLFSFIIVLMLVVSIQVFGNLDHIMDIGLKHGLVVKEVGMHLDVLKENIRVLDLISVICFVLIFLRLIRLQEDQTELVDLTIMEIQLYVNYTQDISPKDNGLAAVKDLIQKNVMKDHISLPFGLKKKPSYISILGLLTTPA